MPSITLVHKRHTAVVHGSCKAQTGIYELSRGLYMTAGLYNCNLLADL